MKRFLPLLLMSLLWISLAVRSAAQCDPYNCAGLPSPVNSSSNIAPLCVAGATSACALTNRPGFLIKGIKSNTYYFTNKYGELTKCNTIVNPTDSINSITITYDPVTKTFGWSVSSAIAVEFIIVKGGPNTNIYNYTGSGRMADGNLHAPVQAASCNFYEIEQVEVGYRYQISVTRTLTPAFTRKYNWSISQGVSNNDWRLFNGDKGVSRYSVSLDQTTTDDSNWGISGTVIIANNTPYTTQVLSILDSLQPGALPIPLNCGGTVFTLVPGAKIQCSYNMPLADGKSRNAVLSVNTLGSVRSRTLTTPVAFVTPTTNINATVTVKDGFGQIWSNIRKDTAWMYDRSLSCINAGTVVNPTTIVETGQSASTSVNVQCYAIQVGMTNNPVFNREWQWDISQASNVSEELLLAPGQQYAASYTVQLENTAQDITQIKGNITLQNPHPSRAALMTNVTAQILSTATGTVNCPASSIAPGGTIVCSYQLTTPDNSPRTVTAAATLQNYTFNVSGSSTPSGGTRFNGSSNAVFPATPVEVDACVTVFDSVDASEKVIGVICAADPIKKLIYERAIGPFKKPSDCLVNNAENAVFFRGNDTSKKGRDGVDTPLKVACQDGCTLSANYWLSHSAYGPKAYDGNWANLGDQDIDGQREYENENFFLSGNTYYQTLQTQSTGNPYWVLAHTYIAAELNVLNGANATSITASLNSARLLLQTYTPAQVPLLPNSIRKQFSILAGVLDRFNIGLIGPGKCSEEGEETAVKPGPESEQRDHPLTESNNTAALRLYPNPAHVYTLLEAEGLSGDAANVTVYNAIGQIVLQQQFALAGGHMHTAIDFDALHMAPGCYRVVIQHAGNSIVKSLIVNR